MACGCACKRKPKQRSRRCTHQGGADAMAVTVITGTRSGIGLATALHFARRGDQVYATVRNLADAGMLRDAAGAENLSLTILPLDVNNESSVRKVIATVLDQAGHI